MEIKKAENLIEALKTQLTESLGPQSTKEVYDHFKKLRATVQKCKTKIDCIKEIKEESVKVYLDDSENESAIKDKIDQLTKILQKTCQRMDDEIKLGEANGDLNNSVADGNTKNLSFISSKKAVDKLDDEASRVFAEKIKLFEESFLKTDSSRNYF